ncbi:MAG: HNH endonuclease signature motif containing protein, partial [Acidimicrobiales bacterium]
DSTTLQRLCCDAGVHRVFVAGRSSILDYGTTTRTIPANLWAALVIRDRHCRFPGCDRPPDWSEAHHIRWVTHGGPTCLDNLALACSRHHHLLHTPGWQAKLLPDATLEITTPTGQIHQSRPPPDPPPSAVQRARRAPRWTEPSVRPNPALVSRSDA